MLISPWAILKGYFNVIYKIKSAGGHPHQCLKNKLYQEKLVFNLHKENEEAVER
jgi:hypothetical protein